MQKRTCRKPFWITHFCLHMVHHIYIVQVIVIGRIFLATFFMWKLPTFTIVLVFCDLKFKMWVVISARVFQAEKVVKDFLSSQKFWSLKSLFYTSMGLKVFWEKQTRLVKMFTCNRECNFLLFLTEILTFCNCQVSLSTRLWDGTKSLSLLFY